MQYLLFVIFKSELYINNQNNKNQLYSNIIINSAVKNDNSHMFMI